MRRKFEQFCSRVALDVRRNSDGFKSTLTDGAWLGWREAFAVFQSDVDSLRARVAELEAEKAELVKDRMFNMQNGPRIPWWLGEAIYAGYAAMYRSDQSVERIHQRGGFDWREVADFWKHPAGRKNIEDALVSIDAAREGE